MVLNSHLQHLLHLLLYPMLKLQVMQNLVWWFYDVQNNKETMVFKEVKTETCSLLLSFFMLNNTIFSTVSYLIAAAQILRSGI